MLTARQRFDQGMQLNQLALDMKLRGILIDQDKRAWHEQRLTANIEAAKRRFVAATSADFDVEAELLGEPPQGEMEERGPWVSKIRKLHELFYEHFGLHPTRFSKETGLP